MEIGRAEIIVVAVVVSVVMVMSVVVAVVMVPAHQQQRADDIDQKPEHRDERRAREIDAHRIDQPQEGFDRDADREDAEDQRRGEAGQIADLAGAEAVARIVAMLFGIAIGKRGKTERARRSEEHTSELQSLMRISYAVFCLKKTKKE